MDKIYRKIALLMVLSSISNAINANDFLNNMEIIVDISDQRLYLIEDSRIIESYPISSSKYGEGSKENSFKTPLGEHIIKEKIGYGVPLNTIFVARVNTNEKANIIRSLEDSEDDYVTSRILWLDGLEEGINKGEGVDSFNRFIYIHGTHEEGLIGQKASHGCIRMFNNDVVKLYDMVKKGTKVYIRV